jgi:hypothetical protein
VKAQSDFAQLQLYRQLGVRAGFDRLRIYGGDLKTW